MNNTDFRQMLAAGAHGVGDNAPHSSPSLDSPHARLPTRGRLSMGLTPRTLRGLPGAALRTQLSEHKMIENTTKRFRSSAAPKGAKLASGYTDRALSRNVELPNNTPDDRKRRLEALEEQLKLGQIARELFEQLREEITGGDITATHLVKGLDRKLLERVRRGEDVLGADNEIPGQQRYPCLPPAGKANEDEELETMERQDVMVIEHEKKLKQGEKASSSTPKSGSKRSRADILAELKASRQKTQQQPTNSELGTRFSRISEKNANSRIERDKAGREMLITLDAEGRLKRKIKKQAPEQHTNCSSTPLLKPDISAKPIGMVIPTMEGPVTPGEEDYDIFENMGSTYNPLHDASTVDDAQSDDESDQLDQQDRVLTYNKSSPLAAHMDDVVDNKADAMANVTDLNDMSEDNLQFSEGPRDNTIAQSISQRRSYFGGTTSSSNVSSFSVRSLQDPTIIAAIRKAAALELERPGTHSTAQERDATRNAQQRLTSVVRDRDLDDVDLGFGSSRFDDEDDELDGPSAKPLSLWHSREGHESKPLHEAGTGNRKRGRKKRKGDKDSAADILKVIEERKAKST